MDMQENQGAAFRFRELFDEIAVPYATSIAQQAQRNIAVTHKSDLPMPAILHLDSYDKIRDATFYRVFHAGEDALSLHGVVTQLSTLERVLAARRASVNRTPVHDQLLYNRFQDACRAKIRSMQKAGIPDSSVAGIVEGWYNGLRVRLIGTPMHILTELSLHARFPGFHETQREALEHLVREGVSVVAGMNQDRHIPPFVMNAAVATSMVTAHALRDLFGVDFLRDFPVKRNDRTTAERLYDILCSVAGEVGSTDDLVPGAEWEIMSRWAEALHIAHFFETTQDTVSGVGEGFLPGTEPVIIETAVPDDESPAESSSRERSADDAVPNREIVAAIRAAIKYFRALPDERVKRITLEMAEIGSGGFNPTDTSRRFTVSAIPGKEFLAYELMAWTYAGFQIVNPDVDTGLNLSREYDLALETLQQ